MHRDYDDDRSWTRSAEDIELWGRDMDHADWVRGSYGPPPRSTDRNVGWRRRRNYGWQQPDYAWQSRPEGAWPPRREKRMAEDLTEAIPGVRDVHNRLRVDSKAHS
jgi:hypothetical protein